VRAFPVAGSSLAWALAAAVAGCGSSSGGQPGDGGSPFPGEVFASPTGFWLDPPVYDHTLYGPTSASANWHVTQWRTPGAPLPPFANGQAATANERVGWDGTSYSMMLDGTSLACGVEFGGFFEPNIASTYAGYPEAGAPGVPLSRMSSLRHRIAVRYVDFQVHDDACKNQGTLMTAFVLRNPRARAMLFYQVSLAFQGFGEGDPWPGGYWWEQTPTEMGYDDSIYFYGLKAAAIGQRASYDIDVLPRIKQLIASSVAADKDLSHWVVDSTYHGAHVWGHITTTSAWDSYSLVQQ